MTVVIRGFEGGVKVFEDRVEAGTDFQAIKGMAERHAERFSEPYMIEMEFLGEIDPNQRFLRFGTDSSMMVLPMEMSFEELLRKPN